MMDAKRRLRQFGSDANARGARLVFDGARGVGIRGRLHKPDLAGGVPDTEYRLLADIASKKLGLPLVVELRASGREG
jgi:hypothetical protein